MKVFLQFFFLIFLSFAFHSCNSQPQEAGGHEHTNKLIESSSPYLLQHAHNPVNWYPWGEEALSKAREENKLLIISIGYAACHWCHVMEHESFEDSTVAALMNDKFVSIKVDREERPDIDQIYMDAAMMINQRGGWPLNAIAMPDGKPVFAGTYFPKEEWLKFLTYFSGLFAEEKGRQRMVYQAAQIAQGLNTLNISEVVPHAEVYTEGMIDRAYESIEKRIDFKKGGLSGAPKFPMPVVHQFLLEHHYYTKEPKALEAVTATLDAMQMGGIYDHLRGGFARYSTDGQWKVPHFEKMLYDNGQLVSLYSKAYQLTKDESYKSTVYETLEWIETEMTDPVGGFYSSLDADSEGEEGKFYVWEAEEIEAILEKDADLFMEYYEVKKGGNWEGKNILHIKKDPKAFAEYLKIPPEQFKFFFDVPKTRLLEARSKRVRPGLDDKILTSWNALMLKGYVDAYKAFGEQKFLEAALRNGNYILDNCLRRDGGLNRNFKNGKSSINAFADDYSFTIEAYLALYEVTFDMKWLKEANNFMQYVFAHFYDEKSGTFFYTSDEDPALITRKQQLQDNVIPSSNSSLAKGLFALGTYYGNQEYLDKAESILNHSLENLEESGPFFANYGLLLNRFVHKPFEVAIVGDTYAEKLVQWNREFHPGVYLLGGIDEGELALLENKLVAGETYIYVCVDKVCKLPVKEVEKAFGLLE